MNPILTREIEIKLNLLCENNYLKLLEYLRANDMTATEIPQKNYFFDTDQSSLSKAGWALRIRIENDRATITAKGSATEKTEGLVIRPETTSQLALKDAESSISSGLPLSALPPNLIDLLDKYIDGGVLKTRLSFANRRTAVNFVNAGQKLVFEVDRTEFCDGSIDFELEVELPHTDNYQKAIDIITSIFNGLDIPILFQKEGKFARALKRMTSTGGPK
jgi:uncharacterized protein YjbK